MRHHFFPTVHSVAADSAASSQRSSRHNSPPEGSSGLGGPSIFGAALAAPSPSEAGSLVAPSTAVRKHGKSSALREFLTLRRGRISPASVGLASTKARRSEGLTREDMAELTGVSFKWYTLFESGAAKGVSRKFAERVVAVLGLGPDERHFLLSLMGFADMGIAADLPSQVPGHLSNLVRSIAGAAVSLQSPLFDVLESNASYTELFPPSKGSSAHSANTVWRLFMDPLYRAIWLDWKVVAACVLSDFRYTSAPLRHTPAFHALMEGLQDSADFVRAWNSADAGRMGDLGGTFDIRTAEGGRRRLHTTVLQAAGAPGFYLSALVFEPAEPMAAAA